MSVNGVHVFKTKLSFTDPRGAMDGLSLLLWEVFALLILYYTSTSFTLIIWVKKKKKMPLKIK